MLRIHRQDLHSEPIVITGIGLQTANGAGREAAWEATRRGQSGIRCVAGEPDIPAPLQLAAPAANPAVAHLSGAKKLVALAQLTAEEAIADAEISWDAVDRTRVACAISAHFGNIDWWLAAKDSPAQQDAAEEVQYWLPNSACGLIASRFGLLGPRFAHSTACASGIIDILTAVRCLRDGAADVALAGSSEVITPIFAAGFTRMRVLAGGTSPEHSCMPFDRDRHGFVMGEGAGMFVLERLSHAQARGAKIYAELVCGKMLADAHHVTSLDVDSEALIRLIHDTVRAGNVQPRDVGYVNAHGTGTEQNDLMESRGIRQAFGSAADDVCVSSLKSMLGHLVNASGSVELAMTVLGMRDGFAPPTMNLNAPDPACDLDFTARIARPSRYQHALKLSLAFGGHLVAALVRRWNDADSGYDYPSQPAARAA